MNLSTYASGHLRPYKTDEEEIGVLEREEARRRRGGIGTFDPENPQEHWWPSSLDFKEEAVRRGPAIAVRSYDMLLAAIRRGHDLSRVYWFGHGAKGELQFGSGQKLTLETLRTRRDAKVSSSFLPDGKILFVACNVFESGEFKQALADSLGVTIVGSEGGVEWNIGWEGESPHRRISRRGLPEGLNFEDPTHRWGTECKPKPNL
jgi:hypothetical protein